MRDRKNYSDVERERIYNSYKRDHLKENPNALESALIGFHGRSLQHESYYDLGSNWSSPILAKCFGFSKTIYYQSDKRDPADPSGEGAQGYDKSFYHSHEKSPVLIYELKSNGIPPINEYATAQEMNQMYSQSSQYRLPNHWAESSGWLGDITEVEYLDLNENRENIKFTDYGLYVWDDMSTLMALPNHGEIDRIILWRSPDLKVNWRGIIN